MRKKTVVIIMVAVMMLSTTVVMAKSEARDIRVYDSDATIYVDGKIASFSSAPFVYNGTTYLPIRGVSDALGEKINYNATDKAIYIGMQPGEPQYMTEVVPSVDQLYGEVYRLDYKTKLELYGSEYKTAVAIKSRGYMEFNLDGKYSEVTGNLGIRGSVRDGANIPVIIYKDNREFRTYFLYGGTSELKKIEVPVKGTKILRIQVDDWDDGTANVALVDPMVTWTVPYPED